MNAMHMAALVYAASIILLTQGFVLTYKTTRAPIIMLGHMATVGAFALGASLEILGLPLILGYPMSFVTGATLMALISLGIIEPLLRRKTSPVRITLATLGLGMTLDGFLWIFSKYTKIHYDVVFSHLHVKHHDFRLFGVPGIFIVATIVTLGFTLATRHIEKRTRFGASLKAYMENPELAQVQGINTNRSRVHLWALAGGMSSLGGAIMNMWFCMNPSSGLWLNTAILAAAVLGGLNSLRGAFLGGLVIGISEMMLVTWGQAYIGVWVGEYRPFIPMIMMCFVLLVAPNGLFGSDIEEYRIRPNPLRKIRKRTLAAVLIWLMLSGALIVNVSNRNKVEAHESMLDDLAGFDLVEMKMNRSMSDHEIGNFTTFKHTVDRLNITEVYITPNGMTVFYIRHNAYWTLRIKLRRAGLWDWVPG